MVRKARRTISFTKSAIEKLPVPVEAREYHYDEKVRGLAVCVTPAGTKTFYVVRRVGKKVERVKLDVWPKLTVDQARDMAEQENGNIANGQNPNDKRRANRKVPTLAEVFAEFIKAPTRTKAKRPKSPRTVHEYELQYKAYLDGWHNRQLSTITRQDVEKLHNSLAKSSGQFVANRVLALVKALFNHAIDQGQFSSNPAARIMGFEEQSRERFLQPDELPKFWAALEAEPSEKLRDFFALCLFTGQRRGNVASMKWADINYERAVWGIPQTKTGRHEVPLIPQAIEILQRRQQDAGSCPYVFTGRHGYGHLQDPMGAWRELLKRAGLENLRIHDLRRSMGSWQSITGASLQIVGKTLGHKRAETTQVYAHLHDDPVRQAMTAATDAMMALAKPAKPEPEKPKRGRKGKGGARNG